jgi:hypothetical protein
MKIDLSESIRVLVETLLPRFSDKNKLLKVYIDARYSYFGGKKEIQHTVEIYLLFHRPGNYTKVFWNYQIDPTEHFSLDSIEADQWVMESDHDSCWISDGVESPLRRLDQKMKSMFPEEVQKNIYEYVSFGFSKPEIIQATLTRKDPERRKYEIKVN